MIIHYIGNITDFNLFKH